MPLKTIVLAVLTVATLSWSGYRFYLLLRPVFHSPWENRFCLLYTSDAADE